MSLHVYAPREWLVLASQGEDVRRLQITIKKDAPCHVSFGKCKGKQQWDGSAQLVEMAQIWNPDNSQAETPCSYSQPWLSTRLAAQASVWKACFVAFAWGAGGLPCFPTECFPKKRYYSTFCFSPEPPFPPPAISSPSPSFLPLLPPLLAFRIISASGR